MPNEGGIIIMSKLRSGRWLDQDDLAARRSAPVESADAPVTGG